MPTTATQRMKREDAPTLQATALDSPHETRVAFLCHAYHRGGVTRWMVDAAAELRKRGAAVWFVAPEPRTPFASGAGRPSVASLVRDVPPEHRPELVARPVGTPFELGTHSYRTAMYAATVLSSVPAGTPIIVSDDEDVWAAAAGLSNAFPMIGILHADDPKYYALARAYGAQLAGCVAVSQRIARNAARETSLSVDTIPCGVPMRPLGETRSNSQPFRIVWIGRVEEAQKRVSDLPRIAVALRDRGVSFVLDVIGDGPQRSALEKQIDERGLHGLVRLCGWRDAESIWRQLCASHVLILPSNYEGMPVVVMEALSAGCAVVASKVSGVEDAAEDALAGRVLFTHEIGDIEGAVSQILRAIDIPERERRSLARDSAARLFSIEVCIDRYEAVLGRIRTSASTSRPLNPRPVLNGIFSLPLAVARAARRGLFAGNAKARAGGIAEPQRQ